VTSSDLADALLVIAEAFLAGEIADAADPEIYQVVVHVGTDTLTPAAPAQDTPARDAAGQAAEQAGVPAETPAAPRFPGHPADPGRCHVQDGPAISVTTAQVLGCTAALSWLLHDRDGTALDAGRRRRRPTTAQRRAARDRDQCRCRYPGCESRRADLHHIRYWAHGGPTTLQNIISLCPAHHRLVHERGYLIASRPGGAFTFYRPDGTELPSCPALLEPGGAIGDCLDADITPGTIIPAWYGEHLDLDHAIYICFANAANAARHDAEPGQHDLEGQHDQGGQHGQGGQDGDHTPGTPPPPRPPSGAQPWTPHLASIDLTTALQHIFGEHALT
jgi:hypothetical protein